MILEVGALSRGITPEYNKLASTILGLHTLISVSMVEKSVDCPPMMPQYSCWMSLLPPTTTVLAPSSFVIVIYKESWNEVNWFFM